jgi:hypothetical protein
MKSLTATAMAALMAVSAIIPATSQPAEARNRGAWIAGGVILGATALAIAGSRRSHASEYYADDEGNQWRRRCHRLLHRCNDGSDWACEKYETSGCTE